MTPTDNKKKLNTNNQILSTKKSIPPVNKLGYRINKIVKPTPNERIDVMMKIVSDQSILIICNLDI